MFNSSENKDIQDQNRRYFPQSNVEKPGSPLKAALANSIHPRSPTVNLYSSSDPDPRIECLRDVKY